MRKILAVLMLLVMISLVVAGEQNHDAVFDQFIGDWRGQGHFFNSNMNSELGTIQFSLRVSSEMEITGSVGSAEILDARISVDNWNDGYMIRATLDGKIRPGHEFEKKFVTFLLNDVRNDIIDGDFHLANNFIFDFSMRPGSISLRKDP